MLQRGLISTQATHTGFSLPFFFFFNFFFPPPSFLLCFLFSFWTGGFTVLPPNQTAKHTHPEEWNRLLSRRFGTLLGQKPLCKAAPSAAKHSSCLPGRQGTIGVAWEDHTELSDGFPQPGFITLGCSCRQTVSSHHLIRAPAAQGFTTFACCGIAAWAEMRC